MSAATDLALSLAGLPAVSLENLVAEAAMMTRVDRKYAVTPEIAQSVLQSLPEGTRALEIEGERAARYASTYFDTAGLECYRRSAQQRRRRLKVRVRTYLDSETAYLELKTRGARGTTVKERTEHPATMRDQLLPAERREIAVALRAIGADENAELHAVLETRYRRSTLLLPGGEGRATIDTGLEWHLLVGDVVPALRRPDLVVIETKSGARPSAVDRLLWRHGQRPVRLSKYGTGLAALAPDLPNARWRRTLRRELGVTATSSARQSPPDHSHDDKGNLMFQQFRSTRTRRTATLASLGLISALVLAGCSIADSTTTAATTTATTASLVEGALSADAIMAENDDATTVNDDEWSVADAVDVTLSSATATSSSEAVSAADGVVTISDAGVFHLSGTLDGQVVIAAPDDAQVVLVLDGVSITSAAGPTIEVYSADDVAVVLADGSENSLVSTGSLGEADANAVLFSEADLTLSGTGALSVSGGDNDGITSEDDLVVLSGSITVDAADDALRGKDSLTISGGTLSLTAGGDALTSDNEEEAGRGWVLLEGGTLTVTAGDDGVDAWTDIVVTDGEIAIRAGDDGMHSETILHVEGGTTTVADSYEGLESSLVSITGGAVDVTATDDGINGTGAVSVEGGTDEVTSDLIRIDGGTVTVTSGSDGIDSNGSVLITGGTTLVQSGAAPESMIDANDTISITGGSVLALGGLGQGATIDEGSLGRTIYAAASGSAGSTVQVIDSHGTVIVESSSIQSFTAVIASTGGITDGATYTVFVDGVETATTSGEAIEGLPGRPTGATGTPPAGGTGTPPEGDMGTPPEGGMGGGGPRP